MFERGLRLVVFPRTCIGRTNVPGCSRADDLRRDFFRDPWGTRTPPSLQSSLFLRMEEDEDEFGGVGYGGMATPSMVES